MYTDHMRDHDPGFPELDGELYDATESGISSMNYEMFIFYTTIAVKWGFGSYNHKV